MSWQNTSILMLRSLMNDTACGETTYSDQRLEELLITAAYLLPIEINFDTAFTINIQQMSISPDPESVADGADLIAFMVLKAACMLDQSAFRTAALLSGISAKLGPASLDTTWYGDRLKTLVMEGPCKSFKELKEDYNFSYDGKQIIRAVISPFVSNDFNPWNNYDRR